MGGTFNEGGNHLLVDDSGNVVVTGYFRGTADFDPSAGTANLTSAGQSDVFLAKYDASGNILWANRMGGTDGEGGFNLALDGSGNVVMTGFFTDTADFDPSSASANLTSAGFSDIFLAKYDASGKYLWANRMGGTDFDQGNSLAVDGSGNIVLTGYFTDTADFDPSAGTANLSSAGGRDDIFLAKYDASGNYLWADRIGGTFDDVGEDLALDGSGNVVMTGLFGGNVDFDPSSGTANLSSEAGSEDIFVAKYAVCNPTSETLTDTACVDYTLNGTTYNSSGTYTQTLTNAAGCDSTLTLNLVINDTSITDVVTTIDLGTSILGVIPENDTLLTDSLTSAAGCDSTVNYQVTVLDTTGRKLGRAADVTLRPNPARTTVTVELRGLAGPATLTLRSLTGQRIQRRTVRTATTELDISGLPAGVYSVRIQHGAAVTTRKLVVH
jgi:cold shock CspA family protein